MNRCSLRKDAHREVQGDCYITIVWNRLVLRELRGRLMRSDEVELSTTFNETSS